MMQRLRLVILVLALAVVVPAARPTAVHAADVPATTDIRIPNVVIQWVKKNAMALYIVFDEIMDDITGSHCPPPQVPPPPPTY
jgi:hypothetical protein